MNVKMKKAQVFDLPNSSVPNQNIFFLQVELIEITDDGLLGVRSDEGHLFQSHWLENGSNTSVSLKLGDRLLCVPPIGQVPSVILGRVGRYQQPNSQSNVTIEATESLTLKCGESSVELRSDGRTMLKGEDVLLRAKGTQRIRAAAVAIN